MLLLCYCCLWYVWMYAVQRERDSDELMVKRTLPPPSQFIFIQFRRLNFHVPTNQHFTEFQCANNNAKGFHCISKHYLQNDHRKSRQQEDTPGLAKPKHFLHSCHCYCYCYCTFAIEMVLSCWWHITAIQMQNTSLGFVCLFRTNVAAMKPILVECILILAPRSSFTLKACIWKYLVKFYFKNTSIDFLQNNNLLLVSTSKWLHIYIFGTNTRNRARPTTFSKLWSA